MTDLSYEEIEKRVAAGESVLSFFKDDEAGRKAFTRWRARKAKEEKLIAARKTAKKPTARQIEKSFLLWLKQGLEMGWPGVGKVALDFLRIKLPEYKEKQGQEGSIEVFTNLWEKLTGKKAGNGNKKTGTQDNSSSTKHMPSMPKC